MRANEVRSLRKSFNASEPIWRIESVIHDGSWYDIDKWARVSKVSKDELKEWIVNNEEKLIKSETGSYRIGYDEILKWYKKQDIDPETSIVPSNFPPKLWAGNTEIEFFINAPRRRVGTVNFEVSDAELYSKTVEILKGVGKILPDRGGRYRAYGLSAVHMRNLLSKGLTEKEYESLDIKTRASLLQRELIDLPDEWLEEALPFYSKVFAPGILKSSMPTIEIYLPDKYDLQSQITIWVITAMKKFDEQASVPFSGYLNSVLRHWPYDLPDEYLGKELSKFQRERKRAIDSVTDGNTDNVPIEEIAEIMEISLEEYIALNDEHENWLAERNATTLTWEDSSNEKAGRLLGVAEQVRPDLDSLANISLAVVKAAVDTEEWKSAYTVISQLDCNEIDCDISAKLSPKFIISFSEHLNER